MSDIRLDKYLWAVRVFKTRSDAADAIRQNRVLVNDAYAKLTLDNVTITGQDGEAYEISGVDELIQ